MKVSRLVVARTIDCCYRQGLIPRRPVYDAVNKKTDVAEHPTVFVHVGLLRYEPPAIAELLLNQSSDDNID